MYWIILSYSEYTIFFKFFVFFLCLKFTLSVILFYSPIFEFCIRFLVEFHMPYFVSKNFIWSHNIQTVHTVWVFMHKNLELEDTPFGSLCALDCHLWHQCYWFGNIFLEVCNNIVFFLKSSFWYISSPWFFVAFDYHNCIGYHIL